MTVPYLTNAQFLALLKQNGWDVASSAYWDKHNRIIVEKDGHSVVIQYLDTYYFPIVVKICEDLGIDPPPDHKKCYDQLKGQH